MKKFIFQVSTRRKKEAIYIVKRMLLVHYRRITATFIIYEDNIRKIEVSKHKPNAVAYSCPQTVNAEIESHAQASIYPKSVMSSILTPASPSPLMKPSPYLHRRTPPCYRDPFPILIQSVELQLSPSSSGSFQVHARGSPALTSGKYHGQSTL